MNRQRFAAEAERLEMGQVRERPAAVPQRRPVVAALGAAGVAGPIVFAVLAVVQSLLRSDHSLVADPVSALAAGPSGWVQDANFMVFGSLMTAYAIGLHLGVRPVPWGIAGPAFLVLSGIGPVWAALFPATDAAGAFHDSRVLHMAGFVMTFAGAGIGLILVSRRMARDPGWRGVATYALTTGIALVVLFAAGGALVRPAGAPFRPWLGLFQWVLLALWLPCTIVLAGRLLQVRREPARSQR